MRRAIVPKHPGWVISDFDFSKIEPRLLAYFASKRGDDTLAGYLRKGRDPYRAVVSTMFDKRDDELTESEYKTGKILFLSLMYGGGVRTIQEQFRLDKPEARRLINQFHDAWPIVRDLQDDIVRVCNKRGHVKTPWGRHLHMENFGEHRMLNKLIQGSAAHALKRALIRVDRWMEGIELESHMILTIHDSIDFDGPAYEAEILHLNVPALMTDEPLIQATVPLLVEHEVSVRNWAEHTPYDEWRTLVEALPGEGLGRAQAV